MKLAICSGDGPQVQQLTQLLFQWLSDIHGQAEVCSFSHPQELLAGYQPGQFAFLFLDVQWEGLDCARQLRSLGEDGPIAFLSQGAEEALACYEVHPAGYLLKPVGREPLFGMLRWYRSLFLPVMGRLTVRVARVERQVLVADLLYVSVEGRTSTLHLTGETVHTNIPLGQLEKKLAQASFFRCHREYLVNPAHIVDLQGCRLLLDDGGELPVSESRLRQAQQLVRKTKPVGRS